MSFSSLLILFKAMIYKIEANEFQEPKVLVLTPKDFLLKIVGN